MVHLRNRKNNYSGILIAISLVIMITVVSLVFKQIFLNRNNENEQNSVLYIQLLNKAMPVINGINYNDEVDTEENISIKGQLLKLIGIDIRNPFSVIGKEISMFTIGTEDSSENNKVVKRTLFKINPFDVNDKQINKSGQDTGDTENLELPNRNVKVNDPKLKEKLDNSKPQVLIYHTHTTESYSPYANYNTSHKKNVCSVGDSLAYNLETEYGISTIHDTTLHNAIFINSYHRSRVTVNKYLKKYKDFKLIIDIHRDGMPSGNVSALKERTTMKMNGENVAKMMFVLPKKNPHLSKNLAVSKKLEKISNKLFPGFCRGIDLHFNFGSVYFNQDLSNNALLIEVGSQYNSVKEADNTGKYLARIIAEYLHSKK
ncbi:stage II sporulation protein P [Clostridium oryzae]|uniref:Stage II sporulation protein SpoIIP n=1 Tax=Clostridium oryzae TaxID=1450648 RepID=A0A1V4IV72_9CLOT|nr:stage II sporulation protein P [Clostridium oryzae]OPJ63836.1 stage II sporulation protein SpoIIP [Clostridium oryzae]